MEFTHIMIIHILSCTQSRNFRSTVNRLIRFKGTGLFVLSFVCFLLADSLGFLVSIFLMHAQDFLDKDTQTKINDDRLTERKKDDKRTNKGKKKIRW